MGRVDKTRPKSNQKGGTDMSSIFFWLNVVASTITVYTASHLLYRRYRRKRLLRRQSTKRLSDWPVSCGRWPSLTGHFFSIIGSLSQTRDISTIHRYSTYQRWYCTSQR